MAGNMLHPVNDSSGSHSHAVDGRPVHIRLPSISGRLHQRSAVAAFMNALHWDALPELHKMHCIRMQPVVQPVPAMRSLPHPAAASPQNKFIAHDLQPGRAWAAVC